MGGGVGARIDSSLCDRSIPNPKGKHPLTWSSSLPGTLAIASITPRTSLAVFAFGRAENSGRSSSKSAASAAASPSATSASMSADTAASRARVASTSAAEGAAVLLAATEAVEEVEASRPRTASARRAAMRSAEEAGDVIFFNQVGNEHRASERERESPEQKSFFPFLAKGSKQEQD